MSEQEMTMQKFEQDFHRLKINREKIPLEQLTTRYERAYTALTDDVRAGAKWYTDNYTQTMAATWPLYEKDEAGNAWLEKKKESILQQEHQLGGLYDQQVSALLDNLDLDAFHELVYRLYVRLAAEAFDPYQQRYNRWTGQPGNRWIYNRLFGWFWNPDTERYGQPYWMDRDWSFRSYDYPPTIGPDPEGGDENG